MLVVAGRNDRCVVRGTHQPADGLPDRLRGAEGFSPEPCASFRENQTPGRSVAPGPQRFLWVALRVPHAMQLCMRVTQLPVARRANSRQNATERDSLGEMYFFQRALNSSR